MPELTTAEAAIKLRVAKQTITTWCRSGCFSGAYKLPGKAGWRIPLAAVDSAVRGNLAGHKQ